MDVTAIATIKPPQLAQAASQTKAGGEGFGEMLANALDHLSRLEGEANSAANSLAAGEPVEIHEVMVAMEQANLGFQLALQVRNKLVEAYQEVMRMPV